MPTLRAAHNICPQHMTVTGHSTACQQAVTKFLLIDAHLHFASGRVIALTPIRLQPLRHQFNILSPSACQRTATTCTLLMPLTASVILITAWRSAETQKVHNCITYTPSTREACACHVCPSSPAAIPAPERAMAQPTPSSEALTFDCACLPGSRNTIARALLA